MERNDIKDLPDPEELWDKCITLSEEEERKLSCILVKQAGQAKHELQNLRTYNDINTYEGEDFSPYTWFVTFVLIDRNCESLEKQLNKEMLVKAYKQQFISTTTALSNDFGAAFNSMVGTINRKVLLGNIHVLTKKIIKAIPSINKENFYFDIFIKEIYYNFLTLDEVAKIYGIHLRTASRYDAFLKAYMNTYLKDVLTISKLKKMIGNEKWVYFFAKYIDEFVLGVSDDISHRKSFAGTQIKLHYLIDNNHLLRYLKKKGDKLTK